jgi:hypothetical protein
MKSLLTGNSNTASGKKSGPIDPFHTIGGPFLHAFPLPHDPPNIIVLSFTLSSSPLSSSSFLN